MIRVTRTRPSNVATSHVQLIKVLTMPHNMDMHYYFCLFLLQLWHAEAACRGYKCLGSKTN